jgi:hypothetical protein
MMLTQWYELTQWYDIVGVIGAVFVGIVAIFAMVVYLEQWLASPEPPNLAAVADRELAAPDDSGLDPRAPDPSGEAGVSHLRRINRSAAQTEAEEEQNAPRDAAADALGLLALVAGQDVEPADGSDGTDGRWVIARKVAPEAVISPVDRQARHTRKSRSQRRDRYHAHLAAEPDTGLITDCEMTMATGEDNTDAAVGVKMAGRDRFHRSL